MEMTTLLQKLINKGKNLSLSLSLSLKSLKQTIIALLFIFSFTMTFAQNVVNFEELTLEPESHWNGSDGSGYFTSGYLKFYNTFEDWGGGMTSWNGFAYTNETDVTTYLYTNEYSSAAGSGVWSSEKYATSYIMGDWEHNYEPIPSIIRITETAPEEIPGMFISVNAYASLYMAEGDFYSDNSHWLKLHIAGFNTVTDIAVAADIMLADYRFENSELDFKMSEWTYIDLSWAQGADSLLFYIYSSDAGEYGVNTPAYFCIDNFGEECPEGVPQMQAEVNANYYINSGESVQIKALASGGVQPYRFEWSEQSGLDNYNSQTPTADPTASTSWTVTITDAIGTEEISTVTVWVDATDIALADAFESNIYFAGENSLIIESEVIISQVNIYDITGKLMISEKTLSSNLNIDVTKLPKGMYIIKLSDGTSVVSKKIMK
jgi:hypothetical protein